MIFIFHAVESQKRIIPKYYEAHIGERIQIECLSGNVPFRKSRVHWTFNNGTIQGYAAPQGSRSKIIEIKSALLIHTGFYTCHGLKKHSRQWVRFFAQAELRVYGIL